jgi:DNA-binding MarR family transcriptional regulator
MNDTDTEKARCDDLGRLDELVGYHLRRASSVFGADFVRAIADEGLRQVPFAILSVISANPGIRQGAAGKALGIQRANMVALINELVDAGHVDRQPSEEDRRAFALSLTPAGAAALARCTDRLIDHENQLLADFSKSERATLIALIRRIEAREQPAAD